MSENSEPGAVTVAARSRISVDRLRERTDELELLISGLTTVALFALPGWLFDAYLGSYAHLPLPIFAGALIALPMISTFAYTLGACFLLHLGVRAYWVGLIGLSAAFPEGIRWERARGVGPLTRARLQASVPPLSDAIARADRLASVLFSLITLTALTLLWQGLLATVLFVAAALIGSAYGATNSALTWSIAVSVLLVIGCALAVWLLDAVLASRWPGLQQRRGYRGLVRALALVVRVAVPERLIAPVRLTLQTNTHPRTFALGFLTLLLVVPMVGTRWFQSQFVFDPFGNQRFVSTQDVSAGLRSPHYESMRTPQDRTRAWPLIPDPTIGSDWLPVFLPYLPLRDDLVLKQRCPDVEVRIDAAASATAAPSTAEIDRNARHAAECLRKLWRLQLDGKAVEPAMAVVAERRDLGYRGLMLYLDLRAGSPGPRELIATWRPDAEQDQATDDYLNPTTAYHLPFLWAPQ